jgi:hypothetical protein
MAKRALATIVNSLTLAPRDAGAAKNKLGLAAAWQRVTYDATSALSSHNEGHLTAHGVPR